MIGIVVIGRNEGQRLKRCLRSIHVDPTCVVYVDSGSTDRSAEYANETGYTVIHLEEPYSAGRARNAGFQRLLKDVAGLQFVQFIDGDCELVPSWLETARLFLGQNSDYAIACGRRKEMYPEHSVYNRLCDAEWDTPVGSAESCGGDFMVRVDAFVGVDGFNENLVAGEEPELCYRLRNSKWLIYRLDARMTLHDAAISRLNQWMKRSIRSGYAYAARSVLHLSDGNRFGWSENLRIAFWALILPATVVLSALFGPWFLAILLVYIVLIVRSYRHVVKCHSSAPRFAMTISLVVGKWFEFIGQVSFLWRFLVSGKHRILEYK